MNRVLALFLFVVFPSISFAEIDVKDIKGRAMKVDVLAYTASSGNVRIKRLPDGAIFNVKLNVFDSDSQSKIKEAAPKAKAKLLAKLSVGKRRKDVPGSSYMETQTITAKASIENQSRDIDFVNGKGTIFLVARETKRYADRDVDYGKILSKEDFQITTNPGQKMSYECRPVVTKYDSDKDSTNVGGWEYYGWMLIIQFDDGEIHSIETSIGNLKKESDEDPQIGEVFLNLKVNQLVEKNLSKKKN